MLMYNVTQAKQSIKLYLWHYSNVLGKEEKRTRKIYG